MRIRLSIVFLLFAALFFFCAGEAAGASIYFGGRRYQPVQTLAARYGMRVSAVGRRIYMYDRLRSVEIQPDKREIRINRMRHHLSFAALSRQNSTWISDFDMLTLFDPVLKPKSLAAGRCRVIVIDPGHGGRDEGARGRLYQEKRITLELAGMLKRELERRGYTVYLTRKGDVYLSLAGRAAIGVRRKADLFISLHVNAAKDRSVSGLETFALTPDGAPSSNSSKVVNTRYPGNVHENNNLMLAHLIQQQMLKKTRAVDRGVKRARFAVLREIKCPAVLVETGFISNAQEERKLGSRSYLNLLSTGIADGVLLYHRAVSGKK